MNFTITDEQAQLRDSLARLVRERFSFKVGPELGANIIEDDAGWKDLAGMGLTALWASADLGGFDAGAVDAYIVMQELGNGLVRQPVFSSALVATTLLARLPDGMAHQALLPDLVAGKTVAVLAWGGMLQPPSQKIALPKATRNGDAWTITGRVGVVPDAPLAQFLVVVAEDAEGETGLYLMDMGKLGPAARNFALIDNTFASELLLEAAHSRLIAKGAVAEQALLAASRIGKAAACARMLGAMRGAFDLAKGYLGTRVQFGKPIGANQVLRHRLAEMSVSLECSESMALLAAIAADGGGADEDVDSAKIFVGRHARFVCEQAIQLHGAIGLTEEYAVGHYLRAILVSEQMFGSGDQLLAQRQARIRMADATK